MGVNRPSTGFLRIHSTVCNGVEGVTLMRGLAWYSAIVLALAQVVMFISILTEPSLVGESVWGFVLNVPILVFCILYLKEK